MRRDRLGRRIGHNPWRELVTDHWRAADHAWWLACENETYAYTTEVTEYRETNPRPNLGDFMRQLAPLWHGPKGREYAQMEGSAA